MRLSETGLDGMLAPLSAILEARKRKDADSGLAPPPGLVKKYKTRAEVEAEKAAAELEKQRLEEAAQRAKLAAVSEIEATTTNPDSTSSTLSTKKQPSPDEVKKRLRAAGQPVTLFGETADLRWERLKRWELAMADRSTTTGRGNIMHDIVETQLNEELRQRLEMQEEMKKRQQHLDGDASISSSSSSTSATSASGANIVTLEQIDRARSDFSNSSEFVLWFFKRLLKEWEFDLNAKPLEWRMQQGRRELAMEKETRLNLRPLFKQLRDEVCDRDMLRHMEQVCVCCQQRDYARASEAYLMLAIGNSAWPMGVTAVGIHARASREKLHQSNVAHVLNGAILVGDIFQYLITVFMCCR